ncbi:MAG: RnfABCDGE type electron transport complex subunit B [Spirochaetes bacterium]|uniref:Ion-translocating oxidoreductase complex subunit B n=1 Tax=Candidatus Ornithospirochaeta stercoripullorum TaxID=2840899 RepID=A0A9D9DZ04_9SPIO|nr:RnfABCDGE type electron transport complex subunit B [Candidatus Ornithospirochaeta stercoripullorum]
MSVVIAFLIVGILGLILGFGLAIADKKLAVEKDPKLVALEEAMPGANCGGCGFAGCQAYAEAVFKGTAAPGLCSPGGEVLAKKMGEILGVEVEVKERMTAFVFCRGGSDVTKTDYLYKGMTDCNAASLLQGGPVGCKEGCLHLGSCISVCPVGAISRDEKGDIVVDKERCIACGKCVSVCPNHVIKMIPYSLEWVCACNNHEPGGKVRKTCQVGCIGCKMCETKVEGSPFAVEAFLSANDWNKDQSTAEKAADICPQKCIVRRS